MEKSLKAHAKAKYQESLLARQQNETANSMKMARDESERIMRLLQEDNPTWARPIAGSEITTRQEGNRLRGCVTIPPAFDPLTFTLTGEFGRSNQPAILTVCPRCETLIATPMNDFSLEAIGEALFKAAENPHGFETCPMVLKEQAEQAPKPEHSPLEQAALTFAKSLSQFLVVVDHSEEKS